MAGRLLQSVLLLAAVAQTVYSQATPVEASNVLKISRAVHNTENVVSALIAWEDVTQ